MSYTIWVNTTEMRAPEELKASGASICSTLYIDVNKSSGEFVISNLGHHDKVLSVENTVLRGANFWKRPAENVLYYRNINLVVFGGRSSGKILLYWSPVEFGVIVASYTRNTLKDKEQLLSHFIARTSELAEMGTVPWKLVKLVKEIKI